MRYRLVVLLLLLSPLTPARGQISIQIGLPGVSIGFVQPHYPQMVAVPGYPVYYDPNASSNYFFYDGMYWVYERDNWYASSWYNGPWALVAPQVVPVFILRIPVSYYRHPPTYFRGWQPNSPPRWGDHWGRDWERQRGGWDRWDRRAAPAPAPLPAYQRQYAGSRYPQQVEQQRNLHERNYRHQPHDDGVRRTYQAQYQHGAPQQPQHAQPPPQHAQPQHSQQQPQHAQPSHHPEQDQGHQGQGQPQGKGHGQPQGKDQGHGQGQGKDQHQDHDKK